MVVVLGTGWSGVTRGGIANGVAVVPEVPGLAPGAFMGQGEGLAVLSRRPCKRARGRMPKRACTE